MNASTLKLTEALVERGVLAHAIEPHLSEAEIEGLPPAIYEALRTATLAENRLLALLIAVAAEQSTVKA